MVELFYRIFILIIGKMIDGVLGFWGFGVLGPTFRTLFMVRVRIRVIS